MGRDHNAGDVYFFGSPTRCETQGCERMTTAHVWDGKRWRAVCGEHQSALQDELRKQR